MVLFDKDKEKEFKKMKGLTRFVLILLIIIIPQPSYRLLGF